MRFGLIDEGDSDRPVAPIGRATVSKTEGCRFDSCLACGNYSDMDIQKVTLIILGIATLVLVLINRQKIQKFISEVIVELRKVSWPTRKELIDSTWIVLISSITFGIFIGITDFVLSKFVSFLIK